MYAIKQESIMWSQHIEQKRRGQALTFTESKLRGGANLNRTRKRRLHIHVVALWCTFAGAGVGVGAGAGANERDLVE